VFFAFWTANCSASIWSGLRVPFAANRSALSKRQFRFAECLLSDGDLAEDGFAFGQESAVEVFLAAR
jgi:hypothetical protein